MIIVNQMPLFWEQGVDDTKVCGDSLGRGIIWRGYGRRRRSFDPLAESLKSEIFDGRNYRTGRKVL